MQADPGRGGGIISPTLTANSKMAVNVQTVLKADKWCPTCICSKFCATAFTAKTVYTFVGCDVIETQARYAGGTGDVKISQFLKLSLRN